jgi:hypothetical protein
MNLPTKILVEIACQLNASDLSNFRCTNRAFGAIGLGLIPRNGISVMNTFQDLRDCKSLLRCQEIAVNVRRLRIYHAEWPRSCSKYD